MMGLITVKFLNNVGNGFEEELQVQEGTTAVQLFTQKMGTASAANFKIRVNREPVTAHYVLQDGDRMTVAPDKIEGA